MENIKFMDYAKAVEWLTENHSRLKSSSMDVELIEDSTGVKKVYTITYIRKD